MADDITAAIAKRIDLLKGQHRSMLETANRMLAEIRSLNAAHLALTGESISGVAETETVDPVPVATSGRERKSDKPTMSRAQIEDAVREILMFSPLNAKEILERLATIAANGNHSRKGLHLVLPRLLANHADFESVGDKWKLRSPEKGFAAFIARVRNVLTTTGPLPESELRREVEAVHPSAGGSSSGRLESALNRALVDGPFEFTGTSWRVKT